MTPSSGTRSAPAKPGLSLGSSAATSASSRMSARTPAAVYVESFCADFGHLFFVSRHPEGAACLVLDGVRQLWELVAARASGSSVSDQVERANRP